MRIAGIGSDNLHVVAHDAAFAMRPDALEAAIAEDRAAGLPAVLRVRHGRHHVDHGLRPRARSWPPSAGARGSGCTSTPPMRGIAALCPELRWVNAGLDQVDSYCTNPHKWMGVNFDCDLFWVADRAALLGALSILPEYLRTAAGEAGAVIDYRDWQIPLGRRFRSLKLWFTLRCDGVAPIQSMIRRPRRPGPRSWPAGWPPTTGSRSWPRTRSTSSASPTVAATRRPTPWSRPPTPAAPRSSPGPSLDGRSFVRVCVGGRMTERRHVEAAWALLQSTASTLP